LLPIEQTCRHLRYVACCSSKVDDASTGKYEFNIFAELRSSGAVDDDIKTTCFFFCLLEPIVISVVESGDGAQLFCARNLFVGTGCDVNTRFIGDGEVESPQRSATPNTGDEYLLIGT